MHFPLTSSRVGSPLVHPRYRVGKKSKHAARVECTQGFGVVGGVATPSRLPMTSLPRAELLGQTAQVKDASGVLKADALRVVGAAVKCQARENVGAPEIGTSTPLSHCLEVLA